MDNKPQPKPLPEKVMRRHFEMIQQLLPDFETLVFDKKRPADALLNQHLRSHRELGSRDRRFLSQALFSYFRWYGWTVRQLGLSAPDACLVGAMLDSTQMHPSLAYMQQRGNLPSNIEPIGERTLSEKRDIVEGWFKDVPNAKPINLRHLLPEDFALAVAPDAIERCIAEFQQRPPAWIRSRTETANLAGALDEQKIPHRIHDHVPNAIAVESGISLQHKLNDYTSQFAVQDIASQCVGLISNPAKDEDWWDCCAGAGGKTLHLMDLMQQDGKVLATDVRAEALKELKKRARRHGIRNIRTQPFNAANDEPFTKTFDGVMVDAPCSGWGTWARNPDARWRSSLKDVAQCTSRQLKIMNNVKWCVKPGGVLVYAVCTLTRPETEEVVMNFLDQNPNFELNPFSNPLTGKPTDGQLQIWPWDAPGDAMFIARFIRKS